MKSAAAFLLGVLCTAALAAAPRAASKHVDTTYGYSLSTPDFPAAAAGENCTSAMFFAPAKDGFAANVNVLIQQTAIGLDEYAKVTRDQLPQLGGAILEEKKLKVSGRDAMRWEYTGKVQGRELHWLALAVPARDRVYLVTATSSQTGWAASEKAFRACLDTFALTD